MEAWWSLLPGALTVVALVSLALVLALLVGGAMALRRGRPFRAAVRLLFAALFGLLLLALALLALGVRGYQALSHEQTAAVVAVEPTAHQRFIARFLFPDGRTGTFALAGDELYVDARVIKWHYWANLMGLRTAYELDRVAGRYRLREDEVGKPRTLHSLAGERAVDLFQLRSRFQALAPVYDAEYGTATFVPADQPAMYEILVSPTGLFARPVRAASEPGT